MKLSEIKNALSEVTEVIFQLPNGKRVPSHFHVTEVGKISKHFIDCGGTERKEERISFQLWSSIDLHHRLQPSKLLHIIELSEKTLQLTDEEVEVEYQQDTIGKFGLSFNGSNFVLTTKKTDCLASDACGITVPKQIKQIAEVVGSSGCCDPKSGCC